MDYMQDSYKSSESSLRPQDEETPKGAGIYQPQKPPAEASAKGGEENAPDEPDYEELFVRDAIRRAQDEELAALASLAMIRSGTGERSQIRTDSGPERMPHSKKPKETLEQIIRESEGPGKK